MNATKSIEEVNRELGDQVFEDAKRNPQKYGGKYIGIANGQVVCSGDSLNDVVTRLRTIELDAQRLFIVDTTRDPNKVLRISETWYALFPLAPKVRPSDDSSDTCGSQGPKNDTDASR